jgi:hypothetical protein
MKKVLPTEKRKMMMPEYQAMSGQAHIRQHRLNTPFRNMNTSS